MTPMYLLEDVANFLDSVEWTDQNAERDAGDYAEQLRQAANVEAQIRSGAYYKLLTSWAELKAEHDLLRAWRDDVTAALMNPGGTRFHEVPQLIRDIITLSRRDHADLNALSDAVAGPDRNSVEDSALWTIETLVKEAINLRDNGPDVPVVRLHELINVWRARQDNIQDDYWQDQGIVGILESAIAEVETVIAHARREGHE